MSSTDCVKVVVRVRPMVRNELDQGCIQVIQKTFDAPQIEVSGTLPNVQNLYTFDHVFMPESTQGEVYDESVKHLIGSIFEGYNMTILAYGQTGSGKTYTMGTNFHGRFDDQQAGVIPRALNEIFQEINSRSHDTSVKVTCSFLELYQEVIYDLLSGKPKLSSKCEVREDDQSRIFVTGLSEKIVYSKLDLNSFQNVCLTNFTIVSKLAQEEAANCLIEGSNNREVGATAMNDESSRSHAIFIVNLEVTQNDGVNVKSKFTLVDLAGSERSKKTKATGVRFREGVKINKGLLALGNVISALGGGEKNIHVSYRDSKLTRLLQDSLGGNSVTLMIACISPSDFNADESLSTLRYADRAKKIRNKPVKNQNSKDAEITHLKKQVQELEMRIVNNGLLERCGNECLQKMEKKDKDIIALRHQLSQLMKTVYSMNDKNVIEESFFNEANENIQKLKKLLKDTCPAEFVMPDTKIFDEIRDLVDSIDNLMVKFQKDILNSDENEGDDAENFDESNFNDDASKHRIVEYTNNQMKALIQIKNLEREMKIKQDLLERKNANQPFLHERSDSELNEYKEKIAALEKELEEFRETQINQSRRDHNVTKVNLDRKTKITELEKQLQEYRKKCQTLEQSKRLADQDRKRVEDLKREIGELKTARIQLIKQQRRETEQYQKWQRTKTKEIAVLYEKERKHKHDIIRLERSHERQQAVLKRKVEEAKAVNKRLQIAMDKSRNMNSIKNLSNSKVQTSEVIQNYVDHELEYIMSSVDAKISMHNLMNDRGILTERIKALKAYVNKTPEMEQEISRLEDDLNLRKAQINDMREKVQETDLENKVKSIPENFKTVGELKIALSYIIRAIIESREDFTKAKTIGDDLKMVCREMEDRIRDFTDQTDRIKEETAMKIESMEADFEKKLGLIYSFFENGDKLPQDIPDLKGSKYQEFCSLMKDFGERSESSQNRIKELEDEVKRLSEQLDNRAKKSVKKYLPRSSTVNNEDSDEGSDLDDDDEYEDEEGFDINDSFTADPDWVKTPRYQKKRRTAGGALKESLRNFNATGILQNISESSDSSGIKRSFSGVAKCSCKGSCATKQCGCKKNENYCTDTCRCSEACLNVPDDGNSSQESKENGVAAKEEEKEKTPEKVSR
jgi:kinesin family member 4